MAGYCLHSGGTGYRNPSRERRGVERDAILLHVATGSFIRWTELTEAEREKCRAKALYYREQMAEVEGVS